MKPKTWKSYIQIREGSLLKFDYPEEGFERPNWQRPPQRKTYTGEVTDHTKRRIIQAVDIMLQNNPTRRLFNPITGNTHDFRVSFATLTITDDIKPDMREGNEALAKFLRHFKRPWHRRKMSEQISQYVWKAELQRRGTLHYHITSTAFLHHVEVNRVWNDIQKKYGWTQSYARRTGNHYPNSTDIHAVWQVKNLGGYISKYMGKKDIIDTSHIGFLKPCNPVQLGGKIWGCSSDLRGAKRFTTELDEYTWKKIKASLHFKAIEEKEMERCTFYTGAGIRELSLAARSKYNDWML